jgi:hypothetical protein
VWTQYEKRTFLLPACAILAAASAIAASAEAKPNILLILADDKY